MAIISLDTGHYRTLFLSDDLIYDSQRAVFKQAKISLPGTKLLNSDGAQFSTAHDDDCLLRGPLLKIHGSLCRSDRAEVN